MRGGVDGWGAGAGWSPITVVMRVCAEELVVIDL